MKPALGSLVTLKNVTENELIGIPAGGSKYVFLNVWWFQEVRAELVNLILGGSLVGYDVSGVVLPTSKTCGIALEMIPLAETFTRAVLSSSTPNSQYETMVIWNIEAADTVVATIRSEMINNHLVELGVEPLAILSKLEGPLSALIVGMFAEAAQLVDTIATDSFLTTERLAIYKSMLLSADAIHEDSPT